MAPIASTAVATPRAHSIRKGCARRPRVQSSDREAVTMQITACTATNRDSPVARRGPTWSKDDSPIATNSMTPKK